MSNIIETLAQDWLNATGKSLGDTLFDSLQDVGLHIINNDMSTEAHGNYQYEVSSVYSKDGTPWIIRFDPTYSDIQELKANGLAEIVGTLADGTVQLVEIGFAEFVVLSDNTVITRTEDNAAPEAFWPYEI